MILKTKRNRIPYNDGNASEVANCNALYPVSSVSEPLELLGDVLLVERPPVGVVVLARRCGAGRLGVLDVVELLERGLGALRLRLLLVARLALELLALREYASN